MAAIFNFNDICEFEIEGEKFRVDVGEIQGEKAEFLRNLGAETAKIKDVVEAEGEEVATEKLYSLMRQGVDTVLGEGAFAKIFKDIKPTLLRCHNLVMFITNELEKHKLRQIVPMNRAQRRTK